MAISRPIFCGNQVHPSIHKHFQCTRWNDMPPRTRRKGEWRVLRLFIARLFMDDSDSDSSSGDEKKMPRHAPTRPYLLGLLAGPYCRFRVDTVVCVKCGSRVVRDMCSPG